MPIALPLLENRTGLPCCQPLAAAPELSADDAVRLARRLKALADPVRLRLVAHLLAAPDQEACTCNLAPLVGLSEATVSHHLKKLMTEGVLASKRRDGMNVWYRLDPDALADVSRILDPRCC